MKDITIVVATCGELSEKDCLDAIEPFRNEVEFQIIRNVFPQVKMLNQMIEGVQTEYFVPLDADIILYHDAWPRIENAIRKHFRNPDWHSILFKLFDTLTEREILALKILRTKIAQEYPFKESATPDVEHYQRLTEAGYTCIHDYLRTRPIGEHRVKGKHFCYYKYRDVYQTYKSHNFEWDSGAFMGGRNLRERAKAHFDFFMYKWGMTGNKDYLHCIAGMLDGIMSPAEHKSKTLEKEEYKVLSLSAVDDFMRWYLKNEPLEDEPLENQECFIF